MKNLWDNVKHIKSTDENVSKYVFTKSDAVAESVLYKYPTYADRTVICCSTQSGCPVGCRFCGAGDNFVRSLTMDEIVSQPVRLLEDTGVDPNDMGRLQIMFMSMGEPFLNMRALIDALHKLYALYPKAALLISTSAPDVCYTPIIEVSKQIPTIGLQFSIHESTDEKRNALIPFKKKLNLTQIALVGMKWAEETGRQPFFNYCAHSNNTSQKDADRLCKLFNPRVWQATISVVCERDEYLDPTSQKQRQLAEDFMEKLNLFGYSTRCFDPAGQSSSNGCGQLWNTQKWMKENPDKARPSIGRGLPIIHTPH